MGVHPLSILFFSTSKNPTKQGMTRDGRISIRQNATFSEKFFLKKICDPEPSTQNCMKKCIDTARG
jgi:hypothetical protein